MRFTVASTSGLAIIAAHLFLCVCIALPKGLQRRKQMSASHSLKPRLADALFVGMVLVSLAGLIYSVLHW
jgi:starvation-inducible outer membrane lipoprotein